MDPMTITSEQLMELVKSGAISLGEINETVKELKAEIANKINGVRNELADAVVLVLDSTPEFQTDFPTVGQFLDSDEYGRESLSLTATSEATDKKWQVIIRPVK